MQEEAKILYEQIGIILKNKRIEKNINYLRFCDENDIPVSTYDEILKGKKQTSFYNIFKIIRGLGLNFEEFGKLLDEKIPQSIWDLED